MPEETFVVGLIDGVKVVRLCVDGCALIDDFLFLPIDVFKVFGLVSGLECFLLRVVVKVFESEMLEERIAWSCERVEKGIELLFSAAVVDVVLQLLLLLDH